MGEVPKYHQPEDPSKVKAYNHFPIGNGKPVVSNVEFKKALGLIDSGSKCLIQYLENNFGLDDTQQQLLNNRKK